MIFLLLLSSTLTGLVTQGMKKILDEHECTYRSNMLAGFVAIVVALVVGICNCLVTDTVILDPVAIVKIIGLVGLTWLCSMLGYDKVIQTLQQLGKDDD